MLKIKIEEQFVPYLLALQLKELLDFDEPCMGYYNKKMILRRLGQEEPLGKDAEEMSNSFLNSKYCSAPLWQQAFDFFLEEYDIDVSFKPLFGKNVKKYRCNIYIQGKLNQLLKHEFPDNPYFDSYYEARHACLTKLIELCKKN